MTNRIVAKYRTFSGPWKKAIIGTFFLYWFAGGFAERVFGWHLSLQDFFICGALVMAILWIVKNLIHAAVFRALMDSYAEREKKRPQAS